MRRGIVVCSDLDEMGLNGGKLILCSVESEFEVADMVDESREGILMATLEIRRSE